jgi:hypothetical protein
MTALHEGLAHPAALEGGGAVGAKSRNAMVEVGQDALRRLAFPVPGPGGAELQNVAAGVQEAPESQNRRQGRAQGPVHDEHEREGEPDHAGELRRNEQACAEHAAFPGERPAGQSRQGRNLLVRRGGARGRGGQDGVEDGRAHPVGHARADADRDPVHRHQDQANEDRQEDHAADGRQGEGVRAQGEAGEQDQGLRPQACGRREGDPQQGRGLPPGSRDRPVHH